MTRVTKCNDSSIHYLRVSSESGHVLEWTEEENYVFKLSRFKEGLDEWLGGGVVRPSHFR